MMKTKTMTLKNARRTSGFTMVELLIAIIIIGILVTIIVPVLSNRAADARLAAAKADMEAIANAESQVALDTGYLVRLHVLDDSGAATDGIGAHLQADVVDTIRDADLNLSAGSRDQIFLDAKTGILLPNNIFIRAKNDPESVGWRGPYVNYQRKLKPLATPPAFPWTFGSPLDPWGNPYFLFVAGEDVASGTSGNGLWMNEPGGSLDPTFNYGGFSADARVFDRPTVLSLGPNGQPGNPSNPILGAGDDLLRAF